MSWVRTVIIIVIQRNGSKCQKLNSPHWTVMSREVREQDRNTMYTDHLHFKDELQRIPNQNNNNNNNENDWRICRNYHLLQFGTTMDRASVLERVHSGWVVVRGVHMIGTAMQRLEQLLRDRNVSEVWKSCLDYWHQLSPASECCPLNCCGWSCSDVSTMWKYCISSGDPRMWWSSWNSWCRSWNEQTTTVSIDDSESESGSAQMHLLSSSGILEAIPHPAHYMSMTCCLILIAGVDKRGCEWWSGRLNIKWLFIGSTRMTALQNYDIIHLECIIST